MLKEILIGSKIKKALQIILTSFLFVFLLFGAAFFDEEAHTEEITFLRIGTGPPEGTYFPIGGMVANIISFQKTEEECKDGSCQTAGLVAVAQSSNGSIQNIESINNGLFESILCQGDIAHWAYYADGLYKKKNPVKKLRAIANLYSEAVHIVVRADSKIRTVSDLKGKRVSIGEKKSGSLVTAKIVLKEHGLNDKNVKLKYYSPGQSSDMLKEGKIDAFIQTAGFPVVSVTELADNHKIRLIPIDVDVATKIRKKYPFFGFTVIPEGTYRYIEKTPMLTIGAQWLVAENLSDELVYNMTKTFWSEKNRDVLDNGHPKARQIRIETALTGVSVPLHKGAQRFYEEIKNQKNK